MKERHTVKVEGGPRTFSNVEATLEEEGLAISGPKPMERRGGGVVENVVWVFVAIGTEKALEAAIAKIRQKWPDIRLRIRKD